MEVALTRCHSVLMGKEFQGSASTAANALVWAFVVSVAAFGFELTNSTLGVDDYLWMQRDYNWNSGTVARGMWGYHLLHAVTPEGWVTPFITLLIGIALQISTAVLAGWFIRLPHDRFACLFFFYAIWGTFPYFVAQMAFSYLQIGYAASSFFAVLGILIATGGRTSVKRIALGSFLIAFATSIYQGCIGLLGPVVLLRLISELLQSEGGIYSCRKRMYSVLGKSAVSSLIGIALFTGVHKIVLVAFSIEPMNTRYSVSLDPFFWERWSTISTNMQLVAGGFGEVIPPAALVFLALSGCVGLGCLWSKARNIVLPVQVLCLAGLAFVSIFAVSFVHPEGWLSPRSAVGVGFLWTAILSTPLLARPLWVQRGAAFLASAVLLLFVFHANTMFYSQHLTQEADKIMMVRILERAERVYGDSIGQGPKIITPIGRYRHPNYATRRTYAGSVLGTSNFFHDRGSHLRMSVLAESLGLKSFRWRPLSSDSLGPELADRQPWPSSESVFAHQDAVYVLLERVPDSPGD